MSIELWALLVAGVMTYLTILIQQLNMSKTLGTPVSLSNRDMMPEETPLGGRLRRAATNGVESIAVFAPLVLVAQLTDTSNAWTQYAAIAFMISRILYLPSYALKLVPIRTLVWSLGFFALLVVVNALALVVYLFSGPLAPFVFWSVNGFLLGREYFQLVAMRRIGRDGAKALRRKHGFSIFVAGLLMTIPLSIPIINLLVPVLGAATFTHQFHRLNR